MYYISVVAKLRPGCKSVAAGNVFFFRLESEESGWRAVYVLSRLGAEIPFVTKLILYNGLILEAKKLCH